MTPHQSAETGDAHVRVECPHPNCWAMLKIASDLPPGEYRCICHQIEVRLSWTDGKATLERHA